MESIVNIENHINYVEFPAKKLAATEAFFSEVFGWQFQHWGDTYVSFSNAGLTGGFYLSDKQAVYDQGSPLIVLFSENLEATLTKVSTAGGEIVKPIFGFPGGRRFHFREPSGNEMAVWSDK